MLFNSIEYLFIFLPVVFIIYFLLNKFKLYKTAKLSLLIASLYFYGSYKLDYVWIIISSIIFNYIISGIFKKDLSKNQKKLAITVGIIGNILILLFFKYFTFLASALSVIGIETFSTFKVIMPLGISFFTLQEISYIVDCYRGDVKEYNILDFALFVCFFPQFVAGPVIRHQEMIPQFNDENNRVINHKNVYFALFIITVGLLKKTVFADGFLDYIERFDINYYTGIMCWLDSIIIIFHVYFDFSGYCDLAIGSAILFNIRLPWNFNSPYKAEDIIEYWQRWNMTVVRFFKDYVYIPLGADKKGEIKTFINIMTLFVLYGLWMGVKMGFIAYGVLNGLFVYLNRVWKKLNIKMHKACAVFLTILCLTLLVPFYYCNDFSSLCIVLKKMFTFDTAYNYILLNGFNIVFFDPFPAFKINYLLFVLACYFAFFSKNSTELAELYIKSNNKFYTIILVFVFIVAVLSITRSKEFLYFVF